MMSETTQPACITFLSRQDAFFFLGIENIVTASSDFGCIWNNFFKLGGYEKINPYAIDPHPMNIWTANDAGEKIYFQGLMVGNMDDVPEGYTLRRFPACDFLVITHEWFPTKDEALQWINVGWECEKTAQIPDGYVRYDEYDAPVTIIERENMDTPDGSRYEFWVPVKKG